MFSALQATDKSTLESIRSIHYWTPTLYSFRVTRPHGYQFTAGQYARLGLPDANGTLIWRAYSIVSSEQDDLLEFFVVDVANGAFMSLLRQQGPGNPVLVDKQSYGFMTADRFTDGDELWMLATGTGLGPFISILRQADVWQRFRHLVLVHSVRNAAEFAYQDHVLDLSRQFAGLPAQLQLIQTSTRDIPSEPASGRLHGRITTLLDSGALEQHAGLAIRPETSRVMLCGNPQMIEEARRLLHQRGLRPCRRALPGQFVTENYW